MNEILKRVFKEVFQLQPDTINDCLELTQLETWDSLKHMELIAALEKSFDITLSFDEIVAIHTVSDIKKILLTHGLGA